MRTSAQKAAKQGTQEFFPRSRGGAQQHGGFMFNKAPINKNEARQEAKSKVVHDQEALERRGNASKGRGGGASGFLSKLYQDDEELDNLRVLGAVDDDDEDVQEARNSMQVPVANKRSAKAMSKSAAVGAKVVGASTKVGRLSLKKGALGMFAICEVAPDHLIVNHTRNTKGFISLKATAMAGKAEKYFRVGHFVIASVISEIGSSQSGQIYDFKHGSGVNRKVQMSLEPSVINRLLSCQNIARGMVLQAVVESKEAKGYILNLGFKDETKGFLKFSKEEESGDGAEPKKKKTLKVGQLIHIVVKSVIEASKVVKCEQLKPESHCTVEHTVRQAADDEATVTASHVKPGFLVSARVQRVMENGLELSFLRGITGTCFTDHASTHVAEGSLSAYKVGQKVLARVISADPILKRITLSLTSNIVNWCPATSNKAESAVLKDIKIGGAYENVKVAKALYGGSYLVRLSEEKGALAFLHKTHSRQVAHDEDGDQDQGEQIQQSEEQLEEGQVLPSVRVKEINWFDGVAVVSLRDNLLKAECLNFHQIEVGQHLRAKIAKVDAESRSIVLRVNDFVQGRLQIEHMADHPLKTIPAKFEEVGKEISLRVLQVDAAARLIEFTKKDTLMKEDCPVYKTHKDIKKGDKFAGVVVSSNEYGHVVRSFGTLKGLLTFEDINAKESKKQSSEKPTDYRVGSIVKAYCLFKKAGKGVALTLSKKKAKADADEAAEVVSKKKTLDSQLPGEQDIEQLFAEDSFTTMAKASRNPELVGEVHTFRLVQPEAEGREYMILKSTDAAKKSKNFVAILPRCLVPNGLVLKQSQEVEGLVLQLIGGSEGQAVPLVSVQKELILLKDDIYKGGADHEMLAGQTYVGVVNGLVGTAGLVSVRFLNGAQRTIKVKDLNAAQGYASLYCPGKVIRAAVNKLGRLCTKEKVIEACFASKPADCKTDKEVQLESFAARFSGSLAVGNLKVGDTVEATVQLVKEYGIIAQIMSENADGEAQTGFIVNEQRKSGDSKQYKLGQKLACCVLDIDPVKRIVDLSEKLVVAGQKGGDKDCKTGRQCMATIELNKEQYVIASVKSSKSGRAVGICLLQNFNEDDVASPYQGVQIGDEIAVRVIGKNAAGFLELLPEVKKVREKSKTAGASAVKLYEGAKFKGQIKSIKNQQIFIHAKDEAGSLVLGRLLRSECDSQEEFAAFSKGDVAEVKVLKFSKVSTSKGSTASWMELTRKKAHMKKPEGLDEALKARSLLALSDLKVGQVLEQALVLGPTTESALNLRHSKPLQVQVSVQIKGAIPFNHIVATQELAKFGSGILHAQKLTGGSQVAVTYLGDGNFSLLRDASKAPKTLQKGDLVTARFVKIVRGRGVTVQIDDDTFGFIEQCEITDQLAGNVFRLLEERKVFAARIIDVDASAKWQLSARESVVDEESWSGAIGPAGSSKEFLAQDKARQQSGNLRNKILKYGAAVALSRGDLALGYITNIGKAGCFVQIGHKCTVRAGLNELSDVASFDFAEEMPVGRMVLGRITKVDQPQQANGEKRFHYSTRQSLVVYGVGATDRSKLELGSEVTSIVMAVAEGKAFCQVKGTYIKLKVKDFGQEVLKPGDHVISKLTKMNKQKISSKFVCRAASLGQLGAQMSEEEQLVESMYLSAQRESKAEIRALKALNKQDDAKEAKGADFDHKVVELSEDDEEEMAKQIEDLKELDDLEMNGENAMQVDDDDSDAEEIKKLIQLDQSSGEESQGEEGEQDMDESDEEMESEQDEQNGEAALDESSEDEEAEGKAKKSMLKKRTLKERVKEEQEIREKEKRMRAETDKPQDIDDFERLLVGNQDESYLWIQYMAFMLDNVGLDAARKVAERAVSSVSMANEQDKLNIWTAFMNLESNFGSQEVLESVTKRALEVNDRRKVYLNLIGIYKTSMKFGYIEAIYRQLSKKYGSSLEVWSGYLEFLIEMRHKKKEGAGNMKEIEFSDPKQVLQRALQALSADQHVNIISKFGMLEFKFDAPENGRTMFEGIVSNYPKRMDIWAIYMDMEMKYGQGNVTQARHLFERCLSNDHIRKKPKKMKLVFQKYMEFENKQGNKAKLEALRERVEQYLSQIYGEKESDQEDQAEDQGENEEQNEDHEDQSESSKGEESESD